MKRYIAVLASVVLLSGCASHEGPEYDANSYQKVKYIDVGHVIAERPVTIKDDGAGTFIGTISGVILGSFVGGGRASSLGSLGGGLIGAYTGSEVGKANAEELTVELDSGEIIVVVVKGEDVYSVGDRVRLIQEDDKVVDVVKLH